MELTQARAWREIDLSALGHNARVLEASLAPGCRLMAVVKADAYGHGAVPVARYLQAQGIKSFAVACLSEAVALREAGITGMILILGYTPPEQAELLARYTLTQTVADEAHGVALDAQGIPVLVHLGLDTGMHRLGIPALDREAMVRLYSLRNLQIRGVFSHLCVADGPTAREAAFTQAQVETFFSAVDWLRRHGMDPGETHIQASAGILNLPPQPCTWARAGIALYGIAGGCALGQRMELRPVLSLRARVASVRGLEPGQGAGYGLEFRAGRETKLATVTIGYGDGLPRSLSQSGGTVLLHGTRCPMVGRMCMDQLLVDVTDVPDTRPGDVVTVLGQDGTECIRAAQVAGQCATIPNELLARLEPRLPVVACRSDNFCICSAASWDEQPKKPRCRLMDRSSVVKRPC